MKVMRTGIQAVKRENSLHTLSEIAVQLERTEKKDIMHHHKPTST
jgi:hypothetical protein